MKHNLEWLTGEEGRIVFFEKNVPFLTACFYITGEEEAEFKLQDIVLAELLSENSKMQQKVILKMNQCISKCFLLLWNEGFEEVLLVEQRGTKTAEILDSTDVVRYIYSEYMMQKQIAVQKSTDCGPAALNLTKTEDGYLCENAEKTFFCRLLNYESAEEGKRSFYLYEVEVDRQKRNQGIATSCLTELFCMLAAECPVTMYLQVGSYNEPAVHLYEKLGFTISEELCYYEAEE